MKSFDSAIETRRSIYGIGKNIPVGIERIQEIVEHAVRHVPSPFNSQSARALILFGKESDRFWSIVADALRPLVPPAAFSKTEEKISGFAAGAGTILFFEDMSVVTGLQERFPLYADNFPIWSLQSNGMLEFAVWTALANEEVGASLQHYNPLVDEAVSSTWNLSSSWKLLAQMPFGSIEVPPGEKDFLPIEQRVFVAER